MLSVLFAPDGGLFGNHEQDCGRDAWQCAGRGWDSALFSDGAVFHGLHLGSFHLPGKKAVRLAGASDFPENPSGCDGKADAAAV